MKKLLIVLLILGIAAPAAMAAEVTFSGLTWVIYTWQSFDNDKTNYADDSGDFGGYDGVLQIPYGGKTNGINMKAKISDNLNAYVDLTQGSADGSIEVAYVRHVWADWNFGSGNLAFGYGESQTNVNFVGVPVTQAGGPWILMGNVYPTRKTFMALKFGGFTAELRNNSGGSKSADLAPVTTTTQVPVYGEEGEQIGYYEETTTTTPTANFNDVDALIPEIGLSYKFASKLMMIQAGGMFQTYSVEDHVGEESATINSYLLDAQAKFFFGPANVGILGYYTVNPSDAAILAFADGRASSAAVAADGEVTNAVSMGVALAGGVKFSPKLALNAGISYQDSKMDDDTSDGFYKTCAYLNVSTNIGPINFVPEIGYIDYGEHAGDDMGTEIYVTGSFRIFW